MVSPATRGAAQVGAIALWDRLDCLNPSSLLLPILLVIRVVSRRARCPYYTSFAIECS